MSEEIGNIEPQAQGEGQQPAAVPTAEEPQGLPEDASERTRREFEKLKEHNRKLAEENASLKGAQPQRPSVLEAYLSQPPVQMPQSFAPTPQVAQPQVEQIKRDLMAEDGYVNADELERRLRLAEEAEVRARQAEEKAQAALERVGRFEIDAQKKVLYQEYPELDPSHESFDEDAYDLVTKELLDQIVKSGQQDPLKAASKMSKYFRKPKVSEAQQQTLQERSLASAPVGQTSPRPSDSLDDLRLRSLTDEQAMMERIKRAG